MAPNFPLPVFSWLDSLPHYSMGLRCCFLFGLFPSVLAVASPEVTVEVEELVYRYESANNGAGPMWCAGSTSLFRHGETIFASALETLSEEKPLNNCRWVLMERTEAGWKRRYVDRGRTREPAPMVGFHDGQVFVSGNPTLGAGPEPGGGPARPDIFQFRAGSDGGDPVQLFPRWQGQPAFREHSYRSFAADGERGAFILFQNIGYAHAEWTYRNGDGEWAAAGKIEWPMGEDYDPPRPLRLCYPNVALKDGAVHFFGIGDIVEPNPAWRDFKTELTGRKWDYVFRRLYYSSSPDIETKPFGQWVEIASREPTAGFLWPCDLWLDTANRVHLLWTDQAIDTRLRERFFPEARQSNALNYAILEDGRIVAQKTLLKVEEGEPGLVAGRCRFHVTPDHRLFVVGYFSGAEEDGQPIAENRLIEIRSGGELGIPISLKLERPFNHFFTSTPRAGSKVSDYLDLLGTQSGLSQSISYARIRLE